MVINNFRVISESKNRAEIVYVDGPESVTRHAVKVGKGFEYRIDAILDKDGNEIRPAILEEFKA